MKYYSQADEDRIMIESYLRDIPLARRTYFECGALDGVLYSNTKTLEDSLGWSGILVEPNPVSFAELEKNRSTNNMLFNCVLSNESQPVEFSYFPHPKLAAVSGVVDTFPERHRNQYFDAPANDWLERQRKDIQTIEVNPRKMSEIISEAGVDSIAFASLDVEGHELHVLESHDWSFPVEYFLIENNNYDEIRSMFHRNGYKYVADVSHNQLFHRKVE